jgi:hypothetical protein
MNGVGLAVMVDRGGPVLVPDLRREASEHWQPQVGLSTALLRLRVHA